MMTMTSTTELSPIEKSVRVKLPPAAAFSLFTAQMSAWWPFHSHSIFEGALDRLVFEERAGGEVFEVSKAGARGVWGTVVEWQPPRSFEMTWHPGRAADTAQRLRVRFDADGDGTRVTLVHSDWHKLGADAAATHAGYGGGWDQVLARFVAAR